MRDTKMKTMESVMKKYQKLSSESDKMYILGFMNGRLFDKKNQESEKEKSFA